MKKKWLLCLVLVLATVLSLSALVACEEDNNDGNQPTGDENKVTVSWYNGTTLLKSEEITKGATLTQWTPTVEGKTFMGWYSEISLSIPWDFTTVVNEDVDVFAGFRTDTFTADETEWYLIGTGAGTLKDSNWNETDPEVMKMTKVDEANVNKFTFTATLYEGDSFQIRAKGTWTGQHGVGYLDGYTELEEADGEIIGEVKVNDERYFFAKKGFGDVATGWDINVAKSGIYVLTLQTFPGSSAYDVIYFERTGDAPVIAETHKMAIIGTLNNWNTTYEDDSEWLMIADDATKQSFTLSFFVTEDMYGIKYDSETGEPIQKIDPETEEPMVDGEGNPVYDRYDYAEIKVFNIVNNAYYGDEEDANFKVTKGKYTVKFNVAEDKATVTRESEGFFLAGVLDGADSWIATAKYPLTKVSDTKYVAYYTFTSKDVKDWMEENKGAVKVVYGFSGGTEDLIWYGADNEGANVMIPSSGMYMIELTLNDANDFSAGGIVTATKMTGLYLAGTIIDGDTWAPEAGNEVTNNSIVYNFEDKDTATWLGEGEFAAVKFIEVLDVAEVDAEGNENYLVWYGADADGGNLIIPTAGQYTITLDTTTKFISAVKVTE